MWPQGDNPPVLYTHVYRPQMVPKWVRVTNPKAQALLLSGEQITKPASRRPKRRPEDCVLPFDYEGDAPVSYLHYNELRIGFIYGRQGASPQHYLHHHKGLGAGLWYRLFDLILGPVLLAIHFVR